MVEESQNQPTLLDHSLKRRQRRFLDARFFDVDEMCAAVRSWQLDFLPLSLSAGTTKVGRIIQSRVGPLELAHARFWTSLEQNGSAPEGMLTFAVPEAGMSRLWWRGHDADRHTVLVYQPGSELRCFSGTDFDVHTISISEEQIGAICEINEIPVSLSKQRGDVFHAAGRSLDRLRTLLRRYRDEDRQSSSDSSSTIVALLASGWAARHGRVWRRPTMRARDRAIHKSLELMEASDLAALSPPQLSAHSGVSLRTLEYAFLDRFEMTPAAFLKARRMAAVRDELLRYGPDEEMVTDVMARWGFWHTGQFAKDYRLAFGELPSQTLRERRRLAA